jgi:hypothetical protein
MLLSVGDQSANADDRVVDVLGKLVADGFADLHLCPAHEVVGGREPREVRHGLDDVWLHVSKIYHMKAGPRIRRSKQVRQLSGSE